MKLVISCVVVFCGHVVYSLMIHRYRKLFKTLSWSLSNFVRSEMGDGES
jgi:hypothetical protein